LHSPPSHHYKPFLLLLNFSRTNYNPHIHPNHTDENQLQQCHDNPIAKQRSKGSKSYTIQLQPNKKQRRNNVTNNGANDSLARSNQQLLVQDSSSCHHDHDDIHNNCSTPQRTHLPTHAYSGNFHGVAWNSEGLMCNDVPQHTRKLNKLIHLCSSHDITIVSETHGTDGKAAAYAIPPGTTAFWSHRTGSSAGIGCLVKDSFLKTFNQPPMWTIFCAGHLARLSLQGQQGMLQIWCVYYPNGDRPKDAEARQHLTKTIAQNCLPPGHSLSILAGDWNFVSASQDRLCLSSNAWTGDRDSQEAESFREALLRPFQFNELQQDSFTYFHPISTSRIDRIYTNHHPSTQLDHNYYCTALQHHKGLSKHSPVSFGRTDSSKSRKEGTATNTTTHHQPIKTETIQNNDWRHRVSAEFHHLLFNDSNAHNPIRRLLILKNAIRTVSNNIQNNTNSDKAYQNYINQANLNPQQKLNHTMAFIRAAERSNLRVMEHQANKYQHINSIVNIRDPLTFQKPEFWRLRDHAVDLAREQITNEAIDLHKTNLVHTDAVYLQKKQNILTRLKRLFPGNTNGIGAVEDSDATSTQTHMALLTY
jgi:hypothetical protein